MWFVVAFALLGLLVGNLVGLSSAAVTTSILGLLFTFAGGSAVGAMHKIGPEDRKRASIAIAVLCLFCLLGVYAGIYVAEHKLLSPPAVPQEKSAGAGKKDTFEARKYLRADTIDAVAGIDQEFRNEHITAEQAVEQMLQLFREER